MSNEIRHAGPGAGNGTARKDHKYLSREWKNGRVGEDLRRRTIDPDDTDAHEDLRTSQYWLSENNESYVKALRDYEYAKARYDETPLAKIEAWIDGVDKYWRKQSRK